jgi:hypothetical protein
MILMGLDLSATAAAACVVPLSWDGDFRRVKTLVVGDRLRRDATDEERARRCETIAAQLVAFARLHGVTECWLEGYAFSQRTARVGARRHRHPHGKHEQRSQAAAGEAAS